MIYTPSGIAIGVFVGFIVLVIVLSAWLGRRAAPPDDVSATDELGGWGSSQGMTASERGLARP